MTAAIGTTENRVTISTGSGHRIVCDGKVHWAITSYGTERDGPCNGKADSRHV
jgi:hypothetical protein